MSARSQMTVGIVGAGVIASQVHLPILLAMDDVRVVWLTDANERVARSVAEDHGVAAASLDRGLDGLPEAEVVLIAIPLPPRATYLRHYSPTDTALLVEKPLANDACEHRRLLADFPDWRLAVGFQRRFYGSFLVVRSLVSSGTLGRLRSIRVCEGGRTTRTDGAGQYQSLSVGAGGGITKNLGCHSLDVALWVSDAVAFSIREKSVEWDEQTDQRCRALVDIEVRSGQRVELRFETSWIDRLSNEIEFRFDDGSVVCPVSPTDEVMLRSPAGDPIAPIRVSGADRATTARQAYYLEWRAMLDAVARRTPQSVSAASTLLCAELIDALLDRSGNQR